VQLRKYRTILLVVVAILVLFVASPVLQRFLVLPRSDFFTAMWLLDSGEKAGNFPFNVTSNKLYTGYLGVGNNLGYSASYLIQVKFRNQTQPAADSFNHAYSSLSSLYNVTALVDDKESWEIPISFSFNYTFDKYDDTLLEARFNELHFNDVSLNINGYTSVWDPQGRVFYGNLFFELWIYNDSVGAFQYHDRYVDLTFNMTSNS